MNEVMNAKEFYEFQLNDKTSVVGIQDKDEIIMLMEEYHKYATKAKGCMGDELCKYCSLEKKGVYGVDGGYMAGCEGSRCDDAYDNYLESQKQ